MVWTCHTETCRALPRGAADDATLEQQREHQYDHPMQPQNYLNELFGLNGKTAVVIGGTGTLGGAFCDALAGAGAHVVVVGRNSDAGAAAAGRIKEAEGSGEFFRADSTSREDLDSLVAHLQQNDRHCDVLINGAGINSATPFLRDRR